MLLRRIWGVLLLPVALVLCLLIAVIMVPGWLIGMIPLIGPYVFIAALAISSPLLMLAQYCGLAVHGVVADELKVSGENLELRRLLRRTIIVSPSEIERIDERFAPPFPSVYLVYESGQERRLSLMSDVDVVYDWAENNNVECTRMNWNPPNDEFIS